MHAFTHNNTRWDTLTREYEDKREWFFRFGFFFLSIKLWFDMTTWILVHILSDLIISVYGKKDGLSHVSRLTKYALWRFNHLTSHLHERLEETSKHSRTILQPLQELDPWALLIEVASGFVPRALMQISAAFFYRQQPARLRQTEWGHAKSDFTNCLI